MIPPPRCVPPDAWRHLSQFTQRVYRATCRIPKGQTRSYRWVAARIGRPRAARAVGNALHRNPCLRRAWSCDCVRRGRQASAPCIPCHRVVRADGSLGGYAFGPARKRALLRQEQRRT